MRVVDADPHADDQVGALPLAEEEAGCELGPLGDVLDVTAEAHPERVDPHARTLPDVDPTDPLLGHEDVDVGVADVGEGDDRGPRPDHLARLRRHVEDRSIHRGGQDVALELRLLEGNRALGGVDPGLGGVDLLGAGSVLQAPELLGEGALIGLGALELGREIVGLGLWRRSLGGQPLLPLEVLVEQLLPGSSRRDPGARGLDILMAGARLEEGKLGLGSREVRPARLPHESLEVVVEPRQYLTVGDLVALVHRDGLDAPAHLEARVDVLVLHDALERLRRVGSRTAAPRRGHQDRRQQSHEKRGVLYHTTSNVPPPSSCQASRSIQTTFFRLPWHQGSRTFSNTPTVAWQGDLRVGAAHPAPAARPVATGLRPSTASASIARPSTGRSRYTASDTLTAAPRGGAGEPPCALGQCKSWSSTISVSSSTVRPHQLRGVRVRRRKTPEYLACR